MRWTLLEAIHQHFNLVELIVEQARLEVDELFEKYFGFAVLRRLHFIHMVLVMDKCSFVEYE